MKKTLVAVALSGLAASFSFATVSITGTALQGNGTGITDGEAGIVIVDLDGSGFSTGDLATIGSGLSITDSSTYTGFSVIYSGTIGSFIGPFFDVSAGSVALTNGVDEGDSFGILVFNNSTSTSNLGDTYSIFSDPTWVMPADGSGDTFGTGSFAQLTTAPGSTGTVVPEPSAFALLAGCFGLAWVMVRRRA